MSTRADTPRSGMQSDLIPLHICAQTSSSSKANMHFLPLIANILHTFPQHEGSKGKQEKHRLERGSVARVPASRHTNPGAGGSSQGSLHFARGAMGRRGTLSATRQSRKPRETTISLPTTNTLKKYHDCFFSR